MELDSCPVCNSNRQDPLYPYQYEGSGVCSDFKVIHNVRIENKICLECGLIFNGGGVRGRTEEFYADMFSLMEFKEGAEIKHFGDRGQISQAENSYRIFSELVAPETEGELLEIGAGQGHFLKYCHMDMPRWKITALEPSKSFESLRRNMSNIETYKTDYSAYPVKKNRYDVVVALGVLEHVENPLDMIQWAHDSLKNGGVLFLRVPNFENNPNDLFCVDHLSKITVSTLKWLALESGFELLESKSNGVPLFAVLKKRKTTTDFKKNTYEMNKSIAQTNSVFAEKAIKAILCAREEAKGRGENFGIFGLAMSGLFAPLFADFSPSGIAAYIDENKSVWGLNIHGRPVEGLNGIRHRDIRHIAVTISPAYVDQVKEKLSRYNTTVYLP